MQIISSFPFLKEPFCLHYTDSLSTVYYLNTGALRAIQHLIMPVGRPRQKHAKSINLSSCPAQIPYETKEAKEPQTNNQRTEKTLHLCLVIKLASDMLVF